MADIAATPFINFGESQAKQGMLQSEAAVNTQQAQSMQMQNQILQKQMPYIMRMYEQFGTQSDTSGVAGQGKPGGPLAASADAIDEHGYDPERVSGMNRANYTVPEWTDEERQGTQMALFSGQKNLAEAIASKRQQRLDSSNQQSRVAAANKYDAYAAVATSGNPEYDMQSADPGYYKYLQRVKQQNPDADTTAMAKSYAKYQAADLHQYTGRGLKYDSSIAVDDKTGLPVTGVPKLPMTPKEQAELTMKAQEPSITVQTGHGNTRQMSPMELAGAKSPQEYLQKIANGTAPPPDEILARTAGKVLTPAEMAQYRAEWKEQGAQKAMQNPNQPSADVTKRPGDPNNLGALHPLPVPQKPQQAPPQGQPGQVPPQGQPGQVPPQGQPQQAPQQGQPTQVPPNLLADPRSLPKIQGPNNGPGVSLTPGQDIDTKATGNQVASEMKESLTQQKQNSTERGLIAQAKSEIAKLQSDPRSVGPGSKITNAWNELRTYISGQAPDALVDRKMLDKVLLQMGAANVRTALSGQKITNAEFMKLLNEGNPSTQMPLQALSRLVDFSAYNNEFDTKLQNTKIAAMRSGADPYSQQYADLGQGRAEYVQGRMYPNGVPSSAGPGPDVTQEQHAKLKSGEKYWWKGKQYTKGEK